MGVGKNVRETVFQVKLFYNEAMVLFVRSELLDPWCDFFANF